MKVSIIIPVYNREKLLVETIESVIKQYWRPVEVIVIDDGSTDRSLAVAEEMAQEHSGQGLEIRVLTQPNSGANVARNLGWRSAASPLISFLDSDDTLSVDGLASLVNLLEQDTEADCAIGKVAIAAEDASDILGYVGAVDVNPLPRKLRLTDYSWHTLGALYRCELVEKAGGWHPEIRGSEDWIFQARVKLKARKIATSPKIIGFWREHSGERTGTKQFKASYTEAVTKACHAIFLDAAKSGKLDASNRRRLTLRCLRHVWELGHHGAIDESNRARLRLKEIARGDLLAMLIARFGSLRMMERLFPFFSK